jgi:uncharacterized protein
VKPLKEIRDPVHGFVYLNDTEMKIVGSAPFQRLRYIRQLALTYLVYPGAEHSRFSHSLGVMEFSTQILDILMAKHKADLRWTKAQVAKKPAAASSGRPASRYRTRPVFACFRGFAFHKAREYFT